MIKIIKEKKTKKTKKPYYILKYNYMIGDANGSTSEKCKISLDNPYLERYIKLLNSLEPPKGTWGIVFKEYEFGNFDSQLNEDDFIFLSTMMFEEYDGDIFNVPKENIKYSNEFFEGVKGDTEYSFLVFEGVDLYYYDEYGKPHNTIIE